MGEYKNSHAVTSKDNSLDLGDNSRYLSEITITDAGTQGGGSTVSKLRTDLKRFKAAQQKILKGSSIMTDRVDFRH